MIHAPTPLDGVVSLLVGDEVEVVEEDGHGRARLLGRGFVLLERVDDQEQYGAGEDHGVGSIG
jgi:hypothetical protein